MIEKLKYTNLNIRIEDKINEIIDWVNCQEDKYLRLVNTYLQSPQTKPCNCPCDTNEQIEDRRWAT